MEKSNDHTPCGMLSSNIIIKTEEVDLGELILFEEEVKIPIILETKEVDSALEKAEVPAHALKKEPRFEEEEEEESSLLEKENEPPPEARPVIKVDNDRNDLEKGECLLRDESDLKYSKLNRNFGTQELISHSSEEIKDCSKGFISKTGSHTITPRRSGRITNNKYSKAKSHNGVREDILGTIKKEKNSDNDNFEKGESLLRDDVYPKYLKLDRISETEDLGDRSEEIENCSRGSDSENDSDKASTRSVRLTNNLYSKSINDSAVQKDSSRTSTKGKCLEKPSTIKSRKNLKRPICEKPLSRGDVFSTPSELKDHKPACKKNKGFECDICKTRFFQKKTLEFHILKIHLKMINRCRMCASNFNTQKELNEHKVMCKEKRPFKCTECGAGFNIHYHLRIHIRRHTGEKPYKCDTCDKAFAQNSALTVHKRTHTREKPYKCKECAYSGATRSTLNSHIRNMHSQIKQERFKCPICEKSLKSKNSLFIHLPIHNSEKMHKCNLCDYKTVQKPNLVKHIKIVHNKEKPYECTKCNKCFSGKQNLKIHMRTHTGERPYKCGICGRAFTQRTHLRTHLKDHTGERPYECEVCKKTFRDRTCLVEHVKIHTGEKPYECEVCKKRFRALISFKYHKTLHTNEKPFECDVCKKLFRLKQSLRNHMRNHTGEKPYKCHFCNKKYIYSNLLKHHLNICKKNPDVAKQKRMKKKKTKK